MEFSYSIYIGAKPEDVWEILISPEQTRKIFFGCVMRSTFRVGDRLEYVGPGDDGDETVHIYGELLAYEPHKTLSFIEHPGPIYHANHAELQSRITFTLEPVGECTKLTLVNDQWTEHHPSFEKTKEQWPMILSNIKTLAETGNTLNFGW